MTYGAACYKGKFRSLEALVRKLRKWDLPKETKIEVILSDSSVLKLSVH